MLRLSASFGHSVNMMIDWVTAAGFFAFFINGVTRVAVISLAVSSIALILWGAWLSTSMDEHETLIIGSGRRP